jgi:predicted HicB family RNase H-like nuclease
MIEKRLIQSAQKQIKFEAETLERLKFKMEMLKSSSQHNLRDYDDDEEVCHDVAVRSGGYFMFARESLRDRSKLKVSPSLETLSKANIDNLKEISSKFLMNVMKKMQQLSSTYSYILRIMERERKGLQKAFTPLADDSGFSM